MSSFTRRIAVFLVAGTALVFACKKNDVEPLPVDHYVLSEGVLFPATDGLSVIADTVRISICPPNAYCIAPDNASASIRITKNAENRSVRLFTGFRSNLRQFSGPLATDSTSVQFDGQLYKVILKARYINTKEKGKTGQAILQVSRL